MLRMYPVWLHTSIDKNLIFLIGFTSMFAHVDDCTKNTKKKSDRKLDMNFFVESYN